jgi:hypothetical protein
MEHIAGTHAYADVAFDDDGEEMAAWVLHAGEARLLPIDLQHVLEALRRALRERRLRLAEIQLDQTGMDDRGARIVADFFEGGNRDLLLPGALLLLTDNRITDEGLYALGRLFRGGRCAIDVENNRITDRGAAWIAGHLYDAPDDSRINLGNRLPDPLPANQLGLENMRLPPENYNVLGDFGRDMLATLVRHRPGITVETENTDRDAIEQDDRGWERRQRRRREGRDADLFGQVRTMMMQFE